VKERTDAHMDQLRAYAYRNQQSNAGSANTGSTPSSNTDESVRRIQELNAMEDAAWKAGDERAAQQYADRAHAISRAQIEENMRIARDRGLL
jgi:hypothetical protein